MGEVDLRQYARGRECQIRLPGVCNRNPETVVGCHFRMAGISGMAVKAPDLLMAHGCSACHAYVDTHKDDATARAFLEGVMRTIYTLIREGVVMW